MMRLDNMQGLIPLALLALCGCAGSATERHYGDAVRQTLAAQRIAPEPGKDGPVAADGRRIESVMTVYRTMVGEPRTVVNQTVVEEGQGSQ